MENAQHASTAPLFIVMLIAAVASISLNIGKAVQKMKVEVLRKGKGVFKPPYLKDFLIWCFGMFLTLVAGILFMVAQKMTDKVSLVSALNGVGLVGLAFFAWLVLKEKVGGREWSAVGLIIIGTAAVSYFNQQHTGEKVFDAPALFWSSGIAVIILLVMLAATLKLGKGQAFTYAAMAGVALGLMNAFYHAGPIAAGGFEDQFKTAYPYIGMMIGNCAFVFTNLAFLHGTGITIVPTVNSFMIISPMVFEVFAFKTNMTPMQYAGAAVIVLGVVVLTTGGMSDPKTESAVEIEKDALDAAAV